MFKKAEIEINDLNNVDIIVTSLEPGWEGALDPNVEE